MLILYENAFSPFARKVRLVLEYKEIPFESIDGLAKSNRESLKAVNGRVEVPVVDHDGLVVANSADIVAYLERVFPERPVYPSHPARWAKARAWERCSDTVIDPILVDVSYWLWAERPDTMPEGLLEAAKRDMATVYAALDRALEPGPYVCGELSVADMALFAQLSGAKAVGVPFHGDAHPRVLAWYRRCRRERVFAEDLRRTKAYLTGGAVQDVERTKIFWRGDRIEWLLAQGHHDWFVKEIEAGRVLWPGLGVP